MLSMLTAIISSVLSKKAAEFLSKVLYFIVMALSVATLVYTVNLGTSEVYWMGHFPAPWGNEIRFGCLEGMLAVLFSTVLALSVFGGRRHLIEDVEDSKINLYFVMMDLLLGSLLALIYTNDLFTAYVFVEISTIAACGILIVRRIGRTTIAAVRYMIFSLLGSGLFLIGVVLLYSLTGNLLMESIHNYISTTIGVKGENVPLLVSVSLMSVGLAIKSGLFPFHFWMPDTYGYSTPSSSAVLSGLVSKGYILLLVKVYYRVIGFDITTSSGICDVLFVFGLIGIIVGSVQAIRQSDIRRMVAFSSAAQIGYIYVGIGLGTAAGMAAAFFHILTHAITKPMLFLSASALSDVSGGSKKFSDLQGSGYRNRVAGLAFTIGSLSMVGIPTLAGFVSKLLFATASLGNVGKLLPTLIVLAISTVLNAVYFLRTVIRIYRPNTRPPEERVRLRDQFVFTAVMLIFVALNFAVGMHSQPVVELIERGLVIFA